MGMRWVAKLFNHTAVAEQEESAVCVGEEEELSITLISSWFTQTDMEHDFFLNFLLFVVLREREKKIINTF